MTTAGVGLPQTVARPRVLTWLGYGLGALIAVGLLLGAFTEIVPLAPTEVLAFITGAVTVWLTVRQHIWLWPIGIANNLFFIVVFFQARLYADMSLQVVYIVLSILGWYWWLHGGEQHTALSVSRAGWRTIVGCGLVLVVGTAGMTVFLERVNDSAPLLDALTTVLSLIAQYLLTRKLLENWLVWMTADVIYIGLYGSRELYLTAVLYALFLAMCVAGLHAWRIARLSRSPQSILEA
jgi:nicotinamide mononucleotide transporter